TWKVMAILASGGPNITFRLSLFKSDPDFDISRLSLAVISMGASVLDRMSIENKKMYSLPQEIRTSCLYPKPYHFWMTAYLAYKLNQSGQSVSASAEAAYISDLGYQMLSPTVGRDPSKVFVIEPFHFYNNLIRIDLTFA